MTSLALATPSGAELAREAERLEVLGSVLYIAAHPDDENTRLLAHLVGERGLHTTYLSLTRGGGGQNLVGDQMAELLGVVRTGELLAARSIDGAEQRFTRARDFGYSKSSDEALGSWGHEAVLHDVVRVIREVRPDVVITRFGPTDRTHGHHVASAILAEEAAVKAADPAYLTEGQTVWEVDRILRNQSHWRINEDTDTSGWLTVDVGGYDAARGVSWGAVAAASRTMHKSQGFGSAPQLGSQVEYFSGVAGNVPAVGEDLFAGLDLSWGRLEGSKSVHKALKKLALNPLDPAASLPQLGQVHAAIVALPDSTWRERKRLEVENLMVQAAGLHVTAHTGSTAVSPGGTVPVELTMVARGATVQLERASIGSATVASQSLVRNQPLVAELELSVPDDATFTRPHWLEVAPAATLYAQPEGPERTAADRPGPLQAEVTVTLAGRQLTLKRPVQHAHTDRVHGLVTHDLPILPRVTATFAHSTRMAPVGVAFTVPLTVRGDGDLVEGTLRLTAPEGTVVSPSTLSIALGPDRREHVVEVRITPGSARATVRAEVELDGQVTSFARAVIDLPHLPHRTVLRPAELVVAPVDIQRGPTQTVGYINGSGDEVDQTLSDLGYTVVPLDAQGIVAGELERFDTVVVGIRAFNTHPRLLELQHSLHDWVARGGRLVVQYHTSTSRRPLDLGPKPLTIRRGRVTDQTAAMTVIDPEMPVLNVPNALGPADYEGWVQERGLYFAETWDPAYETVFRMNDAGEESLEGAVVIAKHGEGTFVYTGISFFRQFPAGVPGAARLLANLLAVGAP